MVIEPDQLNKFVDYIDDIQGYLTALKINFIGVDEKVDKYLDFLAMMKKQETDPYDFYQMILELQAVLGVLVTGYPETESEILPCVRIIELLREMFVMEFGK